MEQWNIKTHNSTRISNAESSYGYFIPSGVKCTKGKKLVLPFYAVEYNYDGIMTMMSRINILGFINTNESCAVKYPETLYGRDFHKASVAEVLLALSVVSSGSNQAGNNIGFGLNMGRIYEVYKTTSQGNYYLTLDTRSISNGLINGNEADGYHSGFIRYNVAASDGIVSIDLGAAYYNSVDINVGKSSALTYSLNSQDNIGRSICVSYE